MKKAIMLNKKNIQKLSFEEVLTKYNNLINKFAYKWIKYGFEDIKQIANLAVWKAFNTYDITRNINFSTYASKIISTEILLYIRDNYQKGWEMDNVVPSLDNSILTNGEKEQRFIDNLVDIKAEEELLNKTSLNIILDKLNKEDRLIIIDYYLKDKSQTELAIERKVSQTQICRKIQEILEYLQFTEQDIAIKKEAKKQIALPIYGKQIGFNFITENTQKPINENKKSKYNKMEKILLYLQLIEKPRKVIDDIRKCNTKDYVYTEKFKQIKFNI